MDETKTADIDWDHEVKRLLGRMRDEMPQAERLRGLDLLEQAIEKANNAAWNRGIDQAREWDAEEDDSDYDYDDDDEEDR